MSSSTEGKHKKALRLNFCNRVEKWRRFGLYARKEIDDSGQTCFVQLILRQDSFMNRINICETSLEKRL